MQMRNKPIFTFSIINPQEHCLFMYCLHMSCKNCPTVILQGGNKLYKDIIREKNLVEPYLLSGGGSSAAGFVGLRGFGLEDGWIEDDKGLHDAGLVRVINQRGQGYRGPGRTGTHQGGTKHNTQVTGTHLVIVLELCNPDGWRMNK